MRAWVLSQSKPNGGEQAVGQLREFIAEGGFEPGVRLPPERELCETL
ncbi:MAG: GntR family transcriptional regulator, partial [Rhodobacteraceae bacterium]|nr:GntR family transcriptional regulator [Paracoccaceae bacterium]MCB2160113.1 GntR family transcriptional regulator [Paracoccaceae bacterium]